MTMTRSRLIVLSVIGVVLLYAAGTWVSNRTEWVEHTLPMPPKGEAARNPFYAAQRFADQLGATTSWDRIFVEPSTDAVLVVSSWQWNLSANRRIAIERWVERGGRLVVDNSLHGGLNEFEKWSGLKWKFEARREEADGEEDEDAEEVEDGEEAAEGGEATQGAEGQTGVEGEEAADAEEEADRHGKEPSVTSTPSCRLTVEERDGAPVNPERALKRTLCTTTRRFGTLVASKPVVWGLRDERGLQTARVSVGRGSVTAINGTPFRTRALFDGDHAWLLVAATQMTRGEEIHFLSQQDHPNLLSVAWIRGWPVIVLGALLIALLLWRSAMRFGPLQAPPALARRSLAEQIRGTGQFVLRGGGAPALHAAMVRALEEAVRKNVKGYGALTGEARTAALAAVVGDRGRAEAVAAAMDDGAQTDASDSRRTLARIEAARRHVIGEDRKSSKRPSWGARR